MDEDDERPVDFCDNLFPPPSPSSATNDPLSECSSPYPGVKNEPEDGSEDEDSRYDPSAVKIETFSDCSEDAPAEDPPKSRSLRSSTKRSPSASPSKRSGNRESTAISSPSRSTTIRIVARKSTSRAALKTDKEKLKNAKKCHTSDPDEDMESEEAKLLKRREKARENTRNRRANETEEQRILRLEKVRERQRKIRMDAKLLLDPNNAAQDSNEDLGREKAKLLKMREKARENNRIRRANETEEQRLLRLEKARERQRRITMRAKLLLDSNNSAEDCDEDLESEKAKLLKRREKAKERNRIAIANETEVQRLLRLEKARERQRKIYMSAKSLLDPNNAAQDSNEDLEREKEKLLKRREKARERSRIAIANETEEQRLLRLEKNRERLKKRRMSAKGQNSKGCIQDMASEEAKLFGENDGKMVTAEDEEAKRRKRENRRKQRQEMKINDPEKYAEIEKRKSEAHKRYWRNLTEEQKKERRQRATLRRLEKIANMSDEELAEYRKNQRAQYYFKRVSMYGTEKYKLQRERQNERNRIKMSDPERRAAYNKSNRRTSNLWQKKRRVKLKKENPEKYLEELRRKRRYNKIRRYCQRLNKTPEELTEEEKAEVELLCSAPGPLRVRQEQREKNPLAYRQTEEWKKREFKMVLIRKKLKKREIWKQGMASVEQAINAKKSHFANKFTQEERYQRSRKQGILRAKRILRKKLEEAGEAPEVIEEKVNEVEKTFTFQRRQREYKPRNKNYFGKSEPHLNEEELAFLRKHRKHIHCPRVLAYMKEMGVLEENTSQPMSDSEGFSMDGFNTSIPEAVQEQQLKVETAQQGQSYTTTTTGTGFIADANSCLEKHDVTVAVDSFEDPNNDFPAPAGSYSASNPTTPAGSAVYDDVDDSNGYHSNVDENTEIEPVSQSIPICPSYPAAAASIPIPEVNPACLTANTFVMAMPSNSYQGVPIYPQIETNLFSPSPQMNSQSLPVPSTTLMEEVDSSSSDSEDETSRNNENVTVPTPSKNQSGPVKECKSCGHSVAATYLNLHMDLVHHPHYRKKQCLICKEPYTNARQWLSHYKIAHTSEWKLKLSKSNPAPLEELPTKAKKENYTCEKCNKVLRKKNYRYHNTLYHNPDYKEKHCLICKLDLKSPPEAIKHFNRVHGTLFKNYPSSYRTGGVYKRPSRRKATQDQDRDPAKWPYMCPECGSRFQQKYNLHFHEYHLHGEGANPENYFMCHLCPGKRIKNKYSFIQHMKKYHPLEDPVPKTEGEKKITLKDIYKCHICFQDVDGQKNLNSHVKESHPESYFVCRCCNAVKFTKVTQRLHENSCRTISQKKLKALRDKLKAEGEPDSVESFQTKCEFCPRYFKLSYMWQHYKIIHRLNENGEIHCKLCPKQFVPARRPTFVAHMESMHQWTVEQGVEECRKAILSVESRENLKVYLGRRNLRRVGKDPDKEVEEYEESEPRFIQIQRSKMSCEICSKTLSLVTYRLHLFRKHKIKENKIISCPLSCEIELITRPSYVYHMESVHKWELEKAIESCKLAHVEDRSIVEKKIEEEKEVSKKKAESNQKHGKRGRPKKPVAKKVITDSEVDDDDSNSSSEEQEEEDENQEVSSSASESEEEPPRRSTRTSSRLAQKKITKLTKIIVKEEAEGQDEDSDD